MHCLHTSTQLLINSNVLSSRGDFFLSFCCHYYHYCYSLYCVLSFKSLAILSLQKKNYIFRILFKKKKIYSIFNRKSFKGMCCFFRTTVTSFCVKSHSSDSHSCVAEPVRSRAAFLCLTRKPYQFQRNM